MTQPPTGSGRAWRLLSARRPPPAHRGRSRTRR
jgi:hypothetical protein